MSEETKMKTTFDWSRQTETEIFNALNDWLNKQEDNTPEFFNGVLVSHQSINGIFKTIKKIIDKNRSDQLHEEMIDQGKRSKQQFDGICNLIKHYSKEEKTKNVV